VSEAERDWDAEMATGLAAAEVFVAALKPLSYAAREEAIKRVGKDVCLACGSHAPCWCEVPL
jgi:hypothetical protein